MPTNVIIPALELAQETGKVLRWRKAPGDRVAKGDPIVDIETDKVTVAARHEAYLPPNAGTEQPHPKSRSVAEGP